VPPFFKLTQSVLVDAGFDASTTILLLRNPRFGSFTRVRVGHVVVVKEGDHVFLKALDVVDCTVFNQQCERFGSKATEGFHLRNDLPKERKSVRDAIVAGQLRTLPKVARKAIAAPSAKSVGFKAKNMAKPLRRTYIHEDDDAKPLARKKRKHELHEPAHKRRLQFFRSPTPEDSPSDPSTFSSFVMPPRAASISSVSSIASSPIIKSEPDVDEMASAASIGAGSSVKRAINVDGDDEEDQLYSADNRDGDYEDASDANEQSDEVTVSKIWPTEFYAIDIVEGFEFIHDMMALGSIIEDAFGIQFEGIPYVKTTYNDHLRRWMNASQPAKDKALAAGRSPAGLWSKFMAANPAPYAARKAAKKRMRNAESQSERSASL
jgi:hypothetical protein